MSLGRELQALNGNNMTLGRKLRALNGKEITLGHKLENKLWVVSLGL